MENLNDLINFQFCVKYYTIDENDNMSTRETSYNCQINKNNNDTFKSYITKDLLKWMDIEGEEYRLSYDSNEYHMIHPSCSMVGIFNDFLKKGNENTIDSVTKKIYIIPENEIWIKYIELDEEEIELAKKAFLDRIEEKHILKKRKFNK
jgi:hypothetical protein